jgi:hypothetical protein
MLGVALASPLLLTGAVLLAGAIPAAGAATMSVPGQLLDLRGWSLTLPVAAPGGVNALTVGPAALPVYSLPPYFTLKADGRGRPSGTATLCVRFAGVLQASCLDNGYVLGDAYDLSITVAAGTITVSYNNVVKLTLAYTGTGMSFRVGTYLQTNKGTDANAYGETAVYSLGVSHPTTTTTRWTPKPGVQWQWQLGSTPTAAACRCARPRASTRWSRICWTGTRTAPASPSPGRSRSPTTR